MEQNLAKWKYEYLWEIVEDLCFMGERRLDEPEFKVLDELNQTLSYDMVNRLFMAVYQIVDCTVQKISGHSNVKIILE